MHKVEGSLGWLVQDIPGWNFNAPVLYAFFNSCSVAFGETCRLVSTTILSKKKSLG
jgi:hypothetical protein